MLIKFARSVRTPRAAGVLLLLTAFAAVLTTSAAATPGPQPPSHIGGITRPFTSPLSLGSGDLLYHGGPVMTTNTSYAIYWIPSSYSVPSGYASTINQFFTDVAHDNGLASNVYAVTSQYSGIQYSSAFGGSFTDTSDFPSSGCPLYEGDITECLTDAQIIAEVNKVTQSQGWSRNATNMFFVFTPQAVGSCFDSQGTQGCAYTAYCAYHGYTASGAVYANQPYARHSGCDQGQYPNGASTGADPTINVTSHEHIEAITDPQLNAWYDSAGYEIGDKCAWDFGALSGSNGSEYNQTINGHHYFLQREYSNDGHQCVQTYQTQGGSPPVVSSFVPSSGPVGTSVSVTGSHFTGATGVAFNGTAALTFHVNSDTSLSATVPAGATTGPISVSTGNGSGQSSTDFTVTGGASAPTVSSFSPSSGVVGTSVSITGTGFTGTTAVMFNGTNALTFTVNGDSSLSATVPVGATTGPISVTNGTGTGQSSTNFTVTTSTGPPKVSSFSPTSGPVGTSVSINGSGFTTTTAVKFGTALASVFTVNSDTNITATVPAGARTGKISVTTPLGTGTSSLYFSVTLPPRPSISSFSPTSGKRGSSVTIKGSHFSNVSSVKLGTFSASFSIDSDTQITATVPNGPSVGVSYRWAVTNPGGTTTSFTAYRITG